ncbi:hypothetical protein [Streptomyces sp. NBC_00503]|uniref:hypothetical protein n=1 Tax=Streptomyces sp. NBC_00503 TaxID=2903659 RepID=UPI002E80B971|nr:hypothetical protein [Streptomyces sp. NBC_00503]WUD86298.1 hypothetical protein OG490_35180 [Streptomyces sp. NBC_00503]
MPRAKLAEALAIIAEVVPDEERDEDTEWTRTETTSYPEHVDTMTVIRPSAIRAPTSGGYGSPIVRIPSSPPAQSATPKTTATAVQSFSPGSRGRPGSVLLHARFIDGQMSPDRAADPQTSANSCEVS